MKATLPKSKSPKNKQPQGLCIFEEEEAHTIKDDLYRLTSAVGHFRGTGDAKGWKSDYTLKMDYDTIHNITEKNQHVTGQFTGDTPKDRMKGTYDYNYKYTGTPHAPTVIGNRSFTYDLNGNQLGFEEKGHGSDRTISWDEENRIQSIKDGSQQGGKSTTTGLTFQYDDAGQRIIKEQGEDTTAYINQFFTVKQPMKNSGAIESKHIFAGSTRILTQIVHGEGSAAVAGGGSGASSTSSSSSSTGITHGHGVHSTNHGAKNNSNGNGGGGLGNNTGTNFVTITTDTPVFEGSSLNSQTLGNVVQCDVLTLLTLTPDNQGFYKVEFGGKVGFVPAADAVVGTSPSCEGTSGSVLPKDNFIFYYHTDHLGSTGYMTDWQGKVRENLQYTPFGETWIEQRRGMKIFPDFEFTSKILDSETGLYYYGARYYDPRTSVWQSADPALLKFLPGAKIKYVPKFEREPNWKWVIGLPGEGGVFEPSNLGLFSYAGNNPLKYADPNGEYILSASFMAAYPNASKEIIKLITKLNKLKLEVYKQVTGASAKEVKTAMTEGKGPIITGSFIPKSSEAPNGAYGQQIDSVLMLDIKSTLDKYEKGEISTKLFDATVEHETAHYLAQKHGLEDSSEKGKHERGNDYEMGVYKEITNESNSPVEKEKDK